MLQTRIPHQLCAVTMIACYTVLCLLIVSTEAQEQLPGRSCRNTINFLDANGQNLVPRSDIYDSLKDEVTVDGVCKLDRTCCSESAEQTFKVATSGDYKQKIQTMLTTALMPCHNHTFLGEFVKFIRASKVNLVGNMKRQFGIYFTPYELIFDEFYDYLEKSVWTGNLCDIDGNFTKVSFEMFLAAYKTTSSSRNFQPLPNTENFRSCFYNYFVELRGETTYYKLNGFLRAYNLAMRYVRALKMVENIIEGILDLPLTDQCQSAVMKMTHCAHCAGYNGELLPCQGLCMNSMRGCLVDFPDLVEPIQEFTDAMVNLNNVLEQRYNPWDQITLLNSYFFSIVTDTRDNIVDIKNNVFLRCDADGPTNRNKRSAAATPEGQESIERVRERRVINERAAPPAPSVAINQSSYCLASALPIFTTMAEDVCSRGSIDQTNTNCWTGLTFGSYERTVIDLERSAQRDNPELMVCIRQSRLRKQIAQLRYITRELNIVSGAQACSGDDEDCVDTVPPTCNYFQFPNSYEYEGNPDIIESSSGSGSGSEDGRAGDEDDGDACAEVIEVDVITPTIIIGPDTTDTIDTTSFGGNNDTIHVPESSSGKLSSTSLLTLVSVAVSLFWASGIIRYL